MLGSGDLGGNLLSLGRCLFNPLLAKRDVELLIFNFLAYRLVLAVVTNVVLLLFVFLYQRLSFLDPDLVVCDFRCQLLGVFLQISDTGFQACHFILKVLNL